MGLTIAQDKKVVKCIVFNEYNILGNNSSQPELLVEYAEKIKGFLEYLRSNSQFSKWQILEYGRFLMLKIVVGDTRTSRISPSGKIDKVWHFHILRTQNYREMCETVCGHYIDRDPDTGHDNQRDVTTHRTYALYFGEFPRVEFWGSLLEIDWKNFKIIVHVVVHDRADGNIYSLNVGKDTVGRTVLNYLVDRLGKRYETMRLLLNGSRVGDDQTMESLKIEPGDQLDCFFEQG